MILILGIGRKVLARCSEGRKSFGRNQRLASFWENGPARTASFLTQRRLVVKYRRHYFARMSATLTVNLDSEILQLAEQEARARHTTLAEIVAQQLRVMARNWQDSRAGKTPLTDALRGAVKLPPDFDERTGLTEELQKKHGLGG